MRHRSASPLAMTYDDIQCRVYPPRNQLPIEPLSCLRFQDKTHDEVPIDRRKSMAGVAGERQSGDRQDPPAGAAF